MNKTTKAAVATATGIVLLMGGAGSLAYWTDTANSGATQTINAGTLAVVAADAGAWTKSFNGGASSSVALGTFLMVPGDKLTYAQTFNITANGQDLLFTVGTTNPTLGSTVLGGRLTPTYTVGTLTSSGATVTPSTTPGTYKVAAANGQGTASITVTWTLDWPFGVAGSPTADNPAKNGTVTLTTGAVTLTQVATA